MTIWDSLVLVKFSFFFLTQWSSQLITNTRQNEKKKFISKHEFHFDNSCYTYVLSGAESFHWTLRCRRSKQIICTNKAFLTKLIVVAAAFKWNWFEWKMAVKRCRELKNDKMISFFLSMCLIWIRNYFLLIFSFFALWFALLGFFSTCNRFISKCDEIDCESLATWNDLQTSIHIVIKSWARQFCAFSSMLCRFVVFCVRNDLQSFVFVSFRGDVYALVLRRFSIRSIGLCFLYCLAVVQKGEERRIRRNAMKQMKWNDHRTCCISRTSVCAIEKSAQHAVLCARKCLSLGVITVKWCTRNHRFRIDECGAAHLKTKPNSHSHFSISIRYLFY